VSFIFADLIVLPILNIYRKYYGRRVSLYLLATFYAAMVLAGLAIEILFAGLRLIPEQRDAKVVEAGITWNYTTALNLVFIVASAVLVARFARTGGPAMLRMMNAAPARHDPHEGHPRDAGGSDRAEAGDYACPMHPEVSSPRPGSCFKCGMALVPR